MTTVFYDGSCGLCHRAVQFLLARDPSGAHFRYAPLQGETAACALEGVLELPDSMVVKTTQGRLLTRGDAAINIGLTLGGGWWLVAQLSRAWPRFLRNLAYDFIAKRRYRWFGRKEDACPMMAPEQRALFLP
jgi:predicted DCC family thiol-disulfide oxidoreductase YuxK